MTKVENKLGINPSSFNSDDLNSKIRVNDIINENKYLNSKIRELKRLLEVFEANVDCLKIENYELKEKLNNNSPNSENVKLDKSISSKKLSEYPGIYLLYSLIDDDNEDIQGLKYLLMSKFTNVQDHNSVSFGYGELEYLTEYVFNSKVIICILTANFVDDPDDIRMRQLSLADNQKKLIYYIYLEKIRPIPTIQMLTHNHVVYKAYEKRTRSRPLANVWTGPDFDKFIIEIGKQLQSS